VGSALRALAHYDNGLFLLNRHAVGAEIDAHALGLLAILIELITQDDDNNHQCANDEVDDIAATHDSISIAACLTRNAAKAKRRGVNVVVIFQMELRARRFGALVVARIEPAKSVIGVTAYLGLRLT
jgi:hypothetical protein